MTVSTENRLSGPYNGNGVTTAFGYDFPVISDAHLRVVLTDADGVSTDLALVVDYSVLGVGFPEGGSIEIAVAPATGSTVTILRSLPFTQETDLENQGAFQAQTIEDALDLSVMRDLVLLGRVGNAIHAPDTEDVDMELPPVALRKNSYLLFDGNGEPTYVSSQIDARYYGALSADPATRPDGTARQAGDAYFSTTTLGFRVCSGSGWQEAIPPASLTLVNFTETSASAKTTFTIPGGYTVGATFAYLNGVLLAPSEVTMSNGTTAVLASACAIGDEFRLVGYSPFSVADVLSLSSNLNDLPDKPTARANLGLDSMATQNAGAVAITGGAINGTPVGAVTASTVRGTLVTATTEVRSLSYKDAAGGNTAQINGKLPIALADIATATSQVLAATAAASVGAVGSYAFLTYQTVNTAIVAGSTYSGSLLKYSALKYKWSGTYLEGPSSDGATVSGTWMALGSGTATALYFNCTMFLRIA